MLNCSEIPSALWAAPLGKGSGLCGVFLSAWIPSALRAAPLVKGSGLCGVFFGRERVEIKKPKQVFCFGFLLCFVLFLSSGFVGFDFIFLCQEIVNVIVSV